MRELKRGGRVWGLLVSIGAALVASACYADIGNGPSDRAILSAYTNFWNSQNLARAYNGEAAVYPRVLKILSVRKTGQGITRDTPNGKVLQTDVIFRFQAAVDLAYQCPGIEGTMMMMGLPIFLDNYGKAGMASVRQGSTFDCPTKMSFQKVEEGWLLQFVLTGWQQVVKN